MRSGFKMATAGLALVLGCASCALAPVDVPVSNAALTAEAVAQDAQVVRAGAVMASAASSVLDVQRVAASGHEAPDAAAMHVSSQGVMYRDGVYHATAQGWQGGVPVTVTVSRGHIESVAIGQNSEAAAMADKAQDTVVPQIIAAQSVEDVDLATGATHTSQAILEAVAAALELAAVAQ